MSQISIMVKILENRRFGSSLWKFRIWSKCLKIYILFKIFEKSGFWWIFLKTRFQLKMSKQLDCGQHFWKISIWVKIFKIFRFMSKCWKYLEFSQDFKFPKDVDFGQNFQKNSILVKICENSKFGQNFRKNPIFFETSRFLSKLLKNLHFGHFIVNLNLC